MRGSYRLKLIKRALRQRYLEFKAHRNVAKFPIIAQRAEHGLGGQLIVTLTSYPPRFVHLAKTLTSLLDQTVKADRTILWVAENDIDALPDDVQTLRKSGLEIRSTPDIRSYKKLIPALEIWPDAHFVTADDDVYYPPEWLASLVQGATKHPGDVIAGRVHLASIDEKGNFDSYSTWQLASDLEAAPCANFRLFPTGVGGVLYPPESFHDLVMDRQLFTQLAPRGDDIWFFWMARLAGTQQRRTDQWFDIVEWPDSQDVALAADNLLGDGNDRQIRAMTDHFGPVP